jgi:hypothetical protein
MSVIFASMMSGVSGMGGGMGLATAGGGLLSAIGQFFGGQQIAGAERQAQQTLQQMLAQGTGAIQGYVPQAAGALGGYVQQGAAALQPFAQAGQAALPTLQRLLTPGADMTRVLQQMPGFEFTRNMGIQTALDAMGGPGGSGRGGNVLTGLEQFGTGLASRTYNTLVNQLQGFAGMGTTAGSALASLFGGAGQTASGIYTGAGQNIAQLTGNLAAPIAGTITGAGQAQAQSLMGPLNTMAQIPQQLAFMNLLGRIKA